MPAFTSSAFTRWYLPRLRLRISNCSLLLIYLPRKDERLIRPDWLTYSGWFTHVSGHPPAAGGVQDRESSPVKDRCSTTVPRNPGRLWKTSIWLVGWLVRCLVGDGKFFPVVHPVDAQFAISEFNIITSAGKSDGTYWVVWGRWIRRRCGRFADSCCVPTVDNQCRQVDRGTDHEMDIVDQQPVSHSTLYI